MKNKLNRLISVAVMIALLLTSCVIPMSAMAGTRVISETETNREIISTTVVKQVRRSIGGRITLGSFKNTGKKEVTVNRSYSRQNQVRSLRIGTNANRSDLTGFPGSVSTKKFSVKVKPSVTVYFYATEMVYEGQWLHTKSYQRKVNNEWETYKTESSTSEGTSTYWSFESH